MAFVVFSLGLFFGCKEKVQPFENEEAIPQISLKANNGSHSWYYFTRTDFKPVDKIQNVPFSPLTPWTEAVRISSANCATTEGENKAFAVVNRLGIISFNGEEKQLSKDENIFTDRTAGNLIFLNETPIFSVFKSAFFNDTIKDYKYSAADAQHLFLIQFDPQSRISYPIINCNNLVKLPNSEVIDYYWDGINWTCCVKTISDVKTDFTYINWKPVPSLLTLSPVNANSNISVTESSQDEFRAKKEQLEYKFAPERIKKLLAGFSKKTNFAIDVKTSGGSSWRNYKNTAQSGWAPAGGAGEGASSGAGRELYATAILAQTWSAALFEDGTLFLEGALPGKHILRGGKPVAIRLPKLPVDYVYSDFVISGTTLYAAWEESSFYKTGRAGFVEINLNKSLYSKL
ncbi:hypothetical protein MSI_08810 [Treponema sp. JC4]|uniref:hypothetical protein n=1 Tax=Treponema sp. JC4 TaxID=1124982 RepID=UPI00025B0DCB|nr:hypothetical protein [Treponema sp. JC4]EID85627.1 hypothetical protein MSI_08810 [Treponema sp. JC4]